MKVLVINAGSSSLKYQLIDMENENVLAKGNCERIGLGGTITHTTQTHKDSHEADFPTHAEALQEVVRLVSTGEHAVISDMSEIKAVGHRAVQGAELFSSSTLITDEVVAAMEEIADLAPLHSPPIIMAIKACRKVFPDNVPHVAVFDTAFHQTMPKKAYVYPIPFELSEKYSIRRYGFHGTSHRYVSARLAQVMGKPLSGMKVITCHLGNGSSIAAIDAGKSVDTTMGFTPLEGMIMGTRCGCIDPSIVTFLQEKEGLSTKEVNDILNKKSGYLGVSGLTSDQRDLSEAAEKGNERAALCLEIQQYQIRKQIGAYAAAMGGVDVIIFTGGIGENSCSTRQGAVCGLEFMGVELDIELNAKTRSTETDVAKKSSKVRVFVIPTNEELLIAQDTCEIVSGK